MKEFIKRSISGFIYGTVIVTSLLFARPYYMLIVFAIFAIGCTWEFHKIAGSNKLTQWGGSILTFLGLLVSFGLLVFMSGIDCICENLDEYQAFETIAIEISVIAIWLYVILFTILFIGQLWQKKQEPLHQWGNLLISQIWITIPFANIILVGFIDQWALLLLFITVWISDSGAYFVGSLIGKHKMTPRVSPGKTWEGLAGSVLCGLVITWFLFSDPCDIIPMQATFPWWQSLIMGIVIVTASTLGDLLESLVKRSLGLKDSGKFLPGHGGFLDRFDSMLLAAPVFAILYIFLYSLVA